MDRRGPDECWIWTGGGTRYGVFYRDGKNAAAHRVAYELATGQKPRHVLGQEDRHVDQ